MSAIAASVVVVVPYLVNTHEGKAGMVLFVCVIHA